MNKTRDIYSEIAEEEGVDRGYVKQISLSVTYGSNPPSTIEGLKARIKELVNLLKYLNSQETK